MTDYIRTGKGPLLLLVHGWGDSKESFNALIKTLENNFEIIAPDLPGFGKTQAPKDTWNLENYAVFLKQFYEKTVNQPLKGIIAHSNGGAVVIYGASHQIIKSEKLVLLAASGIRDKNSIKRIIFKVIAKVGKALTFWLPTSTKKKLQVKLYGAAGSDILVAPHLQETFKLTVRQDVQQDASQISIPTLLVYGDKDTATPKQYGEIFHKLIPDSKLEILSGAAHFVHQEQTDKVSALIMDFLT